MTVAQLSPQVVPCWWRRCLSHISRGVRRTVPVYSQVGPGTVVIEISVCSKSREFVRTTRMLKLQVCIGHRLKCLGADS